MPPPPPPPPPGPPPPPPPPPPPSRKAPAAATARAPVSGGLHAELSKRLAGVKEVEPEKEPVCVQFAEHTRHPEESAGTAAAGVSNAGGSSSSIDDAVTVVCVSDVHMTHDKLKMVDGDVLVISGDFTNDGTLSEAAAVNAWIGEVKARHGYRHVVVICGNHEGYGDILACEEMAAAAAGGGLTGCIGAGADADKVLYARQEAVRGERLREVLAEVMDHATHVLYDEAAVIEGIKFYGSPWVPNHLDPQDRKNPRHFDRGFHVGCSQLQHLWRNIPEDVEFLVTHTPPQGVLDINGKGCSMLRLRLAALPHLRVHQFGHVHSGYGYTFIPRDDLRTSVAHVDVAGPVVNPVITDAMLDRPHEAGFPINLDTDVRMGTSLRKLATDTAVRDYAAGAAGMQGAVLFVNAATDGWEQPIYFKLPRRARTDSPPDRSETTSARDKP